ncbi:hypothetical protein BVX98_00900 [bacterium F11]|nr:hypothetical protein BVX98_00900 [bacterium F11]
MLSKINWTPNNKDLRKFGLAILIGFALIGGIVYWRGFHQVAIGLWIGSGIVGALAILLPPLSKPFYWIWMGIAFVMGTVISFLIVAFIYYFIFTPVGLIMRLIGRDALKLKKKSFQHNTYWHSHPAMEDKKIYERLF